MTATYLQPAFTTSGNSSPFAFAAMKAAIVEPFLVLAVSVFWLMLLPFAAFFSAAVALAEKSRS